MLYPSHLIGYILAIVMSLQGEEGQKTKQVAYVMGSRFLMRPTLVKLQSEKVWKSQWKVKRKSVKADSTWTFSLTFFD
jgi:hypothetical protein